MSLNKWKVKQLLDLSISGFSYSAKYPNCFLDIVRESEFSLVIRIYVMHLMMFWVIF